ncbi:MAG: phage tail protein, partial [Pseudomonadota bacterium]
MTDTAYQYAITQAGRRAIEAAFKDSKSTVVITHVAIGDGQWNAFENKRVTKAATAATRLVKERMRVEPLLGGTNPDGVIELHAEIKGGDPEFFIHEVGLFLQDGTLFAVCANKTDNMGPRTKKASVSLVIGVNIAAELPDGVNVEVKFSGDQKQNQAFLTSLKSYTELRKAVEAAGIVWKDDDPSQLGEAMQKMSRAEIKQPTITAPANGATWQALTPTFDVTAFRAMYGTTLAHVEYHVSTKTSFAAADTSIFKSKTTDPFTIQNPLGKNTIYYVRSRFVDSDGIISAWSKTVTFTTADTHITMPTVTAPKADATIIGTSPTLGVDAFKVAAGTDTHIMTQFVIEDVAAPGVEAWNSGELAAGTVPVIKDGALTRGKAYQVKVRLRGKSLGWSQWSAFVKFDIARFHVTTPLITAPKAGATDVGETPTLSASAFAAVGGTDTHKSSQWQILLASDQSVVWGSGILAHDKAPAVPKGKLKTGTKYQIKMRHEGNKAGWSGWSVPITVTTKSAFEIKLKQADGSTYQNSTVIMGGKGLAFMTPGTYKVKLPDGVEAFEVIVIGGGGSNNGGGGWNCGAGGGGARSRFSVAMSENRNCTVTVGKGGISTATTGGASTFSCKEGSVTATGGDNNTSAGKGVDGNVHNTEGSYKKPDGSVVLPTKINGSSGVTGDGGGIGAAAHATGANAGVGFGGGGGDHHSAY